MTRNGGPARATSSPRSRTTLASWGSCGASLSPSRTLSSSLVLSYLVQSATKAPQLYVWRSTWVVVRERADEGCLQACVDRKVSTMGNKRAILFCTFIAFGGTWNRKQGGRRLSRSASVFQGSCSSSFSTPNACTPADHLFDSFGYDIGVISGCLIMPDFIQRFGELNSEGVNFLTPNRQVRRSLLPDAYRVLNSGVVGDYVATFSWYLRRSVRAGAMAAVRIG